MYNGPFDFGRITIQLYGDILPASTLPKSAVSGTIPSARTSEVITPAPRDRGAATARSPYRPSVTRTIHHHLSVDRSLRCCRLQLGFFRCGDQDNGK